MVRGGTVYILTNKNHTVYYTGVTANLIARMQQHKQKLFPNSFSAKYNCDILVYYQSFSTIEQAILEEKRIKAGNRKQKTELILKMNPVWKDLSDTLE